MSQSNINHSNVDVKIDKLETSNLFPSKESDADALKLLSASLSRIERLLVKIPVPHVHVDIADPGIIPAPEVTVRTITHVTNWPIWVMMALQTGAIGFMVFWFTMGYYD